MNVTTLLIGVFALGFGLLTAVLRIARPSALGKLQAMKKSMGDGVGKVVHLIVYTIIPVGVGVALILAGMNRVSIFG